jgi:23S rRNA (uridine2479-2'-O)-methyltransferase
MSKPKYISKSNASFQVFESIKRNRKKRSEYKKFLVEGVRPINTLIDNEWDIIDILYPEDINLSGWAVELIKKNPKAEVFELSKNLYSQLSDKENPTELMVTVRNRHYSLATSKVSEKDIFLVIDRVQNPGNLGSIFRSANAVGVKGIALIGHSTDVYDMQAIRSSIGACFEIPFQYFESNTELEEWIAELKQNTEVEVLGTSAKAEKSIYDFKKTKTTILMIGSEAKGLSEHLVGLTDINLSLPMKGSVSSLNAACSTTAILYQLIK